MTPFYSKLILVFSIISITIGITPEANSQWIQTNLPIAGNVCSLLMHDGDLFAGTDSGLFISNDNGTNWIAVNNGMTGKFVRGLAISGSNLYAVGNEGLFLSSNDGSNWQSVGDFWKNITITSIA